LVELLRLAVAILCAVHDGQDNDLAAFLKYPIDNDVRIFEKLASTFDEPPGGPSA
jgi:hypothetical protein